MFSPAGLAGLSAWAVQPQWIQVRNMATLKDITRRLKSIKNIQKITKSMKMVAAAKYSRAERELKPARVYGAGSLALYEKADIKVPEDKKKHLLIGVSSDRGLCGAIHSSIAKHLKSEVANLTAAGKEVKIVGVGDKLRTILHRSVISYMTEEKPIFSLDTIANAESMSIYDDIDADVLQNYQEYNLANIIYYSLKESTTSEQSARMTAMDNASKNASEMIDKLTLTFNRTRQAVITKELIEIISGAAALRGKQRIRSKSGRVLKFPLPKSHPCTHSLSDSHSSLTPGFQFHIPALSSAPDPLTFPPPSSPSEHPGKAPSTCLLGRILHRRSELPFPAFFQARESIPGPSLCSNGAELPHRRAPHSASAASPRRPSSGRRSESKMAALRLARSVLLRL
ncbi:hypothetical protein J1605_005161 [Eschrichtius robustus]|uniref:ATP synthase F(1) complex subunit gamma, mitochondrial n=1 Tax=Eschrichtius robustus TaxID=9764 RepID=A0AB34HDN3_ESCRO|nr:hypothetical protein J1605_005161 [Eschrichtius robustus]